MKRFVVFLYEFWKILRQESLLLINFIIINDEILVIILCLFRKNKNKVFTFAILITRCLYVTVRTENRRKCRYY